MVAAMGSKRDGAMKQGTAVTRRERIEALDRLDVIARALVVASRVLLALLAALVIFSKVARAEKAPANTGASSTPIVATSIPG
jgi:hypothetical protein